MTEQKQRDLMDFIEEQRVEPTPRQAPEDVPAIRIRQVPPAEPPAWKRMATTGIMVAALAGVGLLGWKAMGSGGKQVTDITALPVIKSVTGPYKAAPKDPGGMAIPDQDKMIFSAISTSGKKEDVIDVSKAKLVPPPEEPAKREKIAELSKKHDEQKAETAKASGESKVENKAAANAAPSADAVASAAPAAGKVVAPVPVAGSAANPAAPEKKEVTAAVVPASTPASEEVVDDEAPEETGPAPAASAEPAQAGTVGASTTNTLAVAAEAPAAPAAVKPAIKVIKVSPAPESTEVKSKATGKKEEKFATKPSGIASVGGVRIQLGAFKTESSLLLVWLQLQKEFPELTKLNHAIEMADLGEKGIFYRLYAGPLHDQAAAETLCGKIKAQNRGCILAK